MTWEQKDVTVSIGSAEIFVKGIQGLAKAGATAIEPVVDLVATLAAVLGSFDGEAQDISPLSGLGLDVSMVHLYPTRPYQVLKFVDWTEKLQKSFELTDTSCAPFPANLLVLLVANAEVDEILDEISDLRALFGKAPPVQVSIDQPQVIDRDSILVRPGTCAPISEQIPLIGQIVSTTTASVSARAPDALSMLVQSTVMKLEAAQRTLDEVNNVLTALSSFNLPNLYAFSGTVNSVDEIADVLRSATGAPDIANYVAGTGILSDSVSGAILGEILT